jgi:hypothetical protein
MTTPEQIQEWALATPLKEEIKSAIANRLDAAMKGTPE